MRAARFTVLGPLMGGAGSQAFLGQEVGPNGPIRPVVMVFLPDEVVDDKDLFDKILDETKVAVQIDHPNVISLHGLAKLDEGYARIVEFADAESMRAIFKRLKSQGRKLPPPLATAMLAEACMGVHYAHELGLSMGTGPMIHGGLRPETLLVSFDGHSKVTGFGAARIAEGLARARGAESSIRDAYTAPEQIFGGRKAATSYTDIYGLGAVLYEALSGKPPFGQDASLAQAITSQQPSEQLLKDVPGPLAEIVLRAMAKEATGRFQSALMMRQALLEQSNVASPEEVARFMDWLFPADSPQRQARRELLNQAPIANPVPTPTTDQEQTIPAPAAAQPSADSLPRPPQASSAPLTAPLPAPTLRPQAAPAPPPSPPQQLSPPKQAVTTANVHTPEPQALSAPPVAAAPPAQSIQVPQTPAAPVVVREEKVVYRTPPIVYAAIGLLVGGAAVLAVILLMRPVGDKVTTTSMNQVPQAAALAPKPSSAKADAALEQVEAEKQAPTKTKETAAKKITAKKVTRRRSTRKKPRPKPVVHSAPAVQATGVLIIQAPSGSHIKVDGKNRGTAPIKPLELKAGRHKIVVTQSGTGVQYRRNVRVKADMDLTMTVQFYNN